MASSGGAEAVADSPTKLSKSERKLAKKQAKACHTLLKHDGIHTVTRPTPILLVANGGLGNGIQRSEIHTIFSTVGPVEDVVMLREKPYCFVKYGNTSLATSAMHRLHGHRLREGQGPSNVTLYLSFVESVPTDKPQSNVPPPGLVIIPDFIDECLEQKIIDSIEWASPSEIANQSLKHRKVKHHGYEFNYSSNNIDRDKPLPGGMPELYGQVINRIMETGHVQFKPDQLTINQYQPGQGIPPHVDTHSAFEDAIISLSLESQIVMEFTHPAGHQVPVVLPRRSLLVMTGEARYKWTHGITPKKTDIVPDPTSPDNLTLHQRGQRTSFTFRAVRRGPCDCKYPEQCDSQKSKAEVTAPPQVVYPKSDEEAAKLEAQQVHVVYNNIAQNFSGTRYKPWPKVVDFLNGLEPGSLVLDVGCGNGKYLGVNKNLHMPSRVKDSVHCCQPINGLQY
ncbi:alkylated DNA repair protein alkB homolog 8 isoform X2 [Strongylocentrotus purpuratus]|uniref:Alkylated DNA repair protein alkB homolog 8 n=1 Tax=Strongylocentrotus purpuratus TaxID=7668 RepID=A0A7M7NI86_STRPU|nr:alkylated DNA repair protein alkB homolog 8 isoform X2 [Strongylocentrotus purpuratus]